MRCFSQRAALALVLDAASLTLALVLAWSAWAHLRRGQDLQLYLRVLPLVIPGFLLGYLAAGLYAPGARGSVEQLRRLSLVSSLGCIGLAGLSFALKLPPTYSRVTLAIFWLLSLATVPAGRTLLAFASLRWLAFREPIAALGQPLDESLVCELRREGLEPVMAPGLVGKAAVKWSHSSGLDAAILYRGPDDQVMISHVAWSFRRLLVVDDSATFPWVAGAFVRPLGTHLVLEVSNASAHRFNRLAKRALDCALALVALTLALPVIVFAAAAIFIVDRGSPVFKQDREGHSGKRIRLLKLRTMRLNAASILERHLDASPNAREQWERTFKLEADPRILPRIGRFLRRYSIDELPQLWNVLAGDMSLVGPRPFPEYHLELLSDDFRELRRSVRPGITGLWQVTVRADGSLEDQEVLDTFYVRNWSIWMDLWILGRTIGAVLSGKGAY